MKIYDDLYQKAATNNFERCCRHFSPPVYYDERDGKKEKEKGLVFFI
jgi:hypothetical protein